MTESHKKPLRARQRKRPVIIGVYFHKGGVGKSTLTLNLGGSFAAVHGCRTLILDADPQKNATGIILAGYNVPQIIAEEAGSDLIKEIMEESFLDKRRESVPDFLARSLWPEGELRPKPDLARPFMDVMKEFGYLGEGKFDADKISGGIDPSTFQKRISDVFDAQPLAAEQDDDVPDGFEDVQHPHQATLDSLSPDCKKRAKRAYNKGAFVTQDKTTSTFQPMPITNEDHPSNLYSKLAGSSRLILSIRFISIKYMPILK